MRGFIVFWLRRTEESCGRRQQSRLSRHLIREKAYHISLRFAIDRLSSVFACNSEAKVFFVWFNALPFAGLTM
jgi:hypothetical protein